MEYTIDSWQVLYWVGVFMQEYVNPQTSNKILLWKKSDEQVGIIPFMDDIPLRPRAITTNNTKDPESFEKSFISLFIKTMKEKYNVSKIEETQEGTVIIYS